MFFLEFNGEVIWSFFWSIDPVFLSGKRREELRLCVYIYIYIYIYLFSVSKKGVRVSDSGKEMEQKHILLSALSVGVGVGVGLGLASGQTVSRWTGSGSGSSDALTAEKMEQELLRQVVEGRESKVTFDEFPYYLRWAKNSYLPILRTEFNSHFNYSISYGVIVSTCVWASRDIENESVFFPILFYIYIYIVMVCRYLWHDCPTLLNCLLFNLLQSRFSCMLLFFSLRILIGFLATFRRSPAFRCNFIRSRYLLS